MSTVRKIFVPTDFSPHADEAVRVAHDLAKATGASVVVFHVSRPPTVVSDGPPTLTDPARAEGRDVRGRPLTEEQKDVWDRLLKIQPSDPAVRVEHEVIVADRPDGSYILSILQERGCDLIVMGARGRSGLRHLLLGSSTDDVIRKAQCPVVVVIAPVHQAGLPDRPVAGQPTSRNAT
jgi:nucleotide-binding universal stress UspA family protein